MNFGQQQKGIFEDCTKATYDRLSSQLLPFWKKSHQSPEKPLFIPAYTFMPAYTFIIDLGKILNLKSMQKLVYLTCIFLSPLMLSAQTELTKPEQTEQWDPEPRVVTPGKGTKPPSDALVIFDGTSLEGFRDKSGNPPKWELKEGVLTVKGGAGDIWSKASFGSFQLHLEWRTPNESTNLKGQGRGNSGIFLQDRYEIQILNSYENRTYANGQAGSIYKQTPPLSNAMNPMGEWQTYDVIYTAPTFRANGSMANPPFVTVIHNGIVIQNHTPIQGTTEYIGSPQVKAHGDAPIRLQDHDNPVSYRNIWVRPL